MGFDVNLLDKYLRKWQDILKLRDWNIKYELVNIEWRKTGDIKIDMDDNRNDY